MDLSHFARIWSRLPEFGLLLGFGLLGIIWVTMGPKGDKDLRIGERGWMYVSAFEWTDFPVFYRTSSPSKNHVMQLVYLRLLFKIGLWKRMDFIGKKLGKIVSLVLK